jgi:hypothetical protein
MTDAEILDAATAAHGDAFSRLYIGNLEGQPSLAFGVAQMASWLFGVGATTDQALRIMRATELGRRWQQTKP